MQINELTTTAIVLIIVACLSGCAQHRPQQAISTCPNPGIDTHVPDFNSRFNSKAVNTFYDCEIGNFTKYPTANMPWYVQTMNSGMQAKYLADNGIPSLDDLRFQKTMWQQVLTKQKTPEAAQETWLLWKQKQAAVRNASTGAASAANIPNRPQNMTCMANGPFVNCNSY